MRIPATLCLIALSLAACKPAADAKPAACGSPEAGKLVTELFKGEVEKGALAFMEHIVAEDDLFKNVSITDARNALAQIQVSLADVRTTEQSNQSSKLRCEASLRLEIPEALLNKAIEGNRLINDSNRASPDFLERAYKREGAYFVRNISYFVQPTDDGQKLFAGLDAANEAVEPVNELVALYLTVDPLKNRQQQIEAEEAGRNAELAVLNQEQLNARLNETKTRHTTLLKDINAAWDKLSKPVQEKLLANQTAWNQAHQRECEYQAKLEYTDELEQQIANLECRSWRIEARIEELQQAQAKMGEQLLKEAEQAAQAAGNRFVAAAEKVPNDILQILGADLQSWMEQTRAQCRRESLQGADKTRQQLAAYECTAKAFDAKAKELEGYSIN